MRMSLAMVRFVVGCAAILAITMLAIAGEPNAVPGEKSADGHSAAAVNHGLPPGKHDKHDVSVHGVSVYVFNAEGQLVGPTDSPKVVLTAAQWRRKLTAEQYHVMHRRIPRRPSAAISWIIQKEGVYTCAGCGLPLFSSARNSTREPAGRASCIR